MTQYTKRQLYKTVVIDPPWQYTPHGSNNFVGKRGIQNGIRNEPPYKQMKDKELESFPINDFAETESCLFMWSTHLKLPIALSIIHKWGYKYHLLMTWKKNTGVTMRGFFRNSEIIIFCYRGRFPIISKGKAIPTVFEGRTTINSAKPVGFYEIIRDKTPEPRIDIFARKRHFGFDAWGNQVENEIQIPITESLSN